MTHNIGDIVRLKSGGPKMTVLGPDRDSAPESGNIACKWFDRNGRLNTGSFNTHMIEAFKAAPPERPFTSPSPNASFTGNDIAASSSGPRHKAEGGHKPGRNEYSRDQNSRNTAPRGKSSPRKPFRSR